MDIQFLGTGLVRPSKIQHVSSLALKLLDEINEVWLFDCGEGTQNRILETTIRHVRSLKSLSAPTCMETISLDCQDFSLAVLFRLMKSKQILKLWSPRDQVLCLNQPSMSGSRLPYNLFP